MKKIFLFVFAFTTIMQAQIAQKVIQKYPAHIIYKINEVTSKIKLTEEQQMKIGKSLLVNDSLANVYKHIGDSINVLKKYYYADKTILKPILSADEMVDYLSQKSKSNRFLIALKAATILKLSTAQIEAVRRENNVLKQDELYEKQMEIFKIKLDTILTKPQYKSLIKIIHEEKSIKQAQEDLNKMIALKMIVSKDSMAICKKLYDYQLLKNCLLDMPSKKMTFQQLIDLKDKVMLEHEPPILTRYHIAHEGYYKKNLFADAILYEKELKLDAKQRDSLLVYYRKKDLTKLINKEKNIVPVYNFYDDLENTNILKILTAKQINVLLLKKNEKAAIQLANNNWEALEKQGLTKDLDKKSTLGVLINYQLKALVAANLVKMDKNATNIFRKRDVEMQKPELLKQLDTIKENQENAKSTKNALKW